MARFKNTKTVGFTDPLASAFSNSETTAAKPALAANVRQVREESDLFFDLSLDLLCIGNFEGRFERVNPAWTHCLGWEIAELIDRPWLDFVHPDDHAKTIKAGVTLMLGEPLLDFENRYRCKDGSYRWLSWSIRTLLEAKKNYCVARDVTTRRRHEDALRANEERFRLMVEGSEQVLFYARDQAHCFTYLSPSTVKVLGYEPNELIGKPYAPIHIARDPVNVESRALVVQALKDRQALKPYLIAARHQDGQRVILEIVESPVFEGDKVLYFQGFARDMTERWRAQNELTVSEARFRSFFEQAAVGMVVVSKDGRFLQVNQRFADILGYTRDELLGNHDAMTFTHPDDQAFEAASMAQLIDGQVSSFSADKRYLHQDGGTVWCKLSMSPLDVVQGEPRQFIGTVEDISENKRAEIELQRSQTMLRIAGNTAKLGGWVIDLPEQVLHLSQEARSIYEAPADFEPTVEQAIAYCPPEDRDRVTQHVSRCAEDGTPFNFETELITAQGHRIWVQAIGEPVRDPSGTIVALQGALQNITARKEIEATLFESQLRFRKMANTFPFIVWTAEPDGQVDYANNAFLTYILPAQSAERNVDWTSYIHPDDVSRCMKAWGTAVRSGDVYLVDYRLREAKTGDYRWHRVRAAPVRDDAGNVVKWYGSAADIDETKSLEQQARTLASRLNNTLEGMNSGFMILDRNWTLTHVNKQLAHMLDQPQQSLLGKNIWIALPHLAERAMHEHFLSVIASGLPGKLLEFQLVHADRWYDLSAYPSDDGLSVFFRDVTETRAANAELKLLRTAVSRLNDIVVITRGSHVEDKSPSIVFVNEAFERRTGYTLAEVIGKTPRILQGPKTQRSELDRIQQALKAWQPVRAELINYTKAGEEFWLELDIVPIADNKGFFTHWVAVERDITERKLAEAAILQLNIELEARVRQRTLQLEAANKELEAFSYSVSHDLRAPLTSINGFSQMLLKSEGAQFSDKEKRYLSRIHAGSARMSGLIDGLLSLAKISRRSLHRTEVNLTGIALKVIQELQEAEPERTVSLHVQPDLTVQGDQAMLGVVMQNLISNAWKYSSKAAEARIDIGSEVCADGSLCVFVRDNGAGFDMAESTRLFEAFHRLHADTEFTGTGIGLANVRRVVERHNGRVWADAAPGQGATFRFTLDGQVQKSQPS